jgi:hypothetical protein
MSFIAAAVVGGSVLSGVIGAVGANSAANTQASAQEQAAQIQQNEFNTTTQQEQPFIQGGQNALLALQQGLGIATGNSAGIPNGYLTQTTGPFSFNPSSITSSPGYQFSQTQGLQQTQNSLAPNVGALSGPTLQALTNYATGNAEQYYNNYFNQAQSQYTTNLNSQQTQQNNIFDRLSTIAGLGQNAAGNLGNTGAQLAGAEGQAVAGAGASQAAGIVGAANALGGGISSAGNGYALSSILNNNGGGSSGYGVPGWTPAQGGS